MAYYENYTGPTLLKATIDNQDITHIIQSIYSGNHNWQYTLWKFNEVFDVDYTNTEFYCEFINAPGERIHWYRITIQNMDECLNPPMGTPISML